MIKYLVLIATVIVVARALNYDERGIDVKINVEKNSNSYLSGRLPQGSFEYGLNVDKMKDNHFQHKVKGPDDVTYGCYGFVDPDGKPHLVHYVSDLKGYRIVPPDSATKIYVARLESSLNNVYQAPQEKNVQWKDLFFPPACKQALTDTDVDTTPAPDTATPAHPEPPSPKPPASPVTTPQPEPVTETTPRRPIPSKSPVTPAPTPEPPTTPRRPSPPIRPVTPSPPPPVTPEPELPEPSNLCPSVMQPPPPKVAPEPACSKVCDELKDELKDIKEQLKTLLGKLAEKPKTGAGGNGSKFAYFPVMLSDGLPDGVDASSAKFAFPTLPQQCSK